MVRNGHDGLMQVPKASSASEPQNPNVTLARASLKCLKRSFNDRYGSARLPQGSFWPMFDPSSDSLILYND